MIDCHFLLNVALKLYVGEKCSICKKKFKSISDIFKKDLICSGKNPLKFACKKCWDKKND